MWKRAETGLASSESPLGAGFDLANPNIPLARYYLRSSHVLAAVIVAVVALLYCQLLLWHSDIWGHLAFGRWMSEHRTLLEHEPSNPFVDRTAPFAHFEWLA